MKLHCQACGEEASPFHSNDGYSLCCNELIVDDHDRCYHD
jgi:hypothetical protein